MSRGKPSAVQEAVQHTREIQYQITVMLNNLEDFCREESFEVNIPALYANDIAHTATLEWGTNVSFARAEELTKLYQEQYVHPRLEVIFLGCVNA